MQKKKKAKTAVSILLSLLLAMPLSSAGRTDIWAGERDNTHVTKTSVKNIGLIRKEETMYADLPDVSGTISIEDKTDDAGILFVRKAPELRIAILAPVPQGSVIQLSIQNGEWFFRDAYNSGEYYTGPIATQFLTNYDYHKGEYTPQSTNSKSGTYTRNAVLYETAYDLTIEEDGVSAKITLLEEGVQGQVIAVPMVVRNTAYEDMYVEISSQEAGIANESVLFCYLPVDRMQSTRGLENTTTYVTDIVTDATWFPLSELVVEENLTGSVKDGVLEITAPAGVLILPDVDTTGPEDITRDTLESPAAREAICIATEGIHWSKGPNKEGPGQYGTDYTIEYRYINDQVDASQIRISFNGLINTQAKNTGAITIKGLKLYAGESAAQGDIKLSISNFRDMGIFPESFLAGVVERDSAYYQERLPANIDNYAIQSLMAMKEFKARAYGTVFENNEFRPLEAVTRGELCQMLYRLLADDEKEYEPALFIDVSGDISQAVAFCSAKGYVTGYPGRIFAPEKEITRGETALILYNILVENASETAPAEEPTTTAPEAKEASLITDLDCSHWAYDAMAYLMESNILTGYENGAVRADNTVTRQEAVTLLNKAFDRGASYTAKIIVSDVHPQNWAYGYIMNAINGGN